MNPIYISASGRAGRGKCAWRPDAISGYHPALGWLTELDLGISIDTMTTRRAPTDPSVAPKNIVAKDIAWMGSSLDDLVKLFPEDMRKKAGQQLRKVQFGEDPDDAEPMPRVGPGAFEIRLTDAAGWYRVIFVAKFEKAVYVLHSFKKKTNDTPKADIDLAEARYRDAKKDAGVK
jgi:phage-related protein